MAVSYFWPPSAIPDSHSVALVEWDEGLLIPQIFHPSLYSFSAGVSGVTTWPVVTDTGVSGIGFVGAGRDVSGTTWLLRAHGDVSYITTATGGYKILPNAVSGLVFTGMAVRGGYPYFCSVSGAVLTVQSNAVVNTGSSLNAHVGSVSSDGTKLYATLPDSGNLATLTFTSQTAWTSANIATPMTFPAFVVASVSGIIVGGWNDAALPNGGSNFDVNGSNTAAVVADPVGNKILMLSGAEPVWSVTSYVSGTGAPVKALWASSDEQVLAADPTNDKVEVFNVTSGTLSSYATLAVSGVVDMCVSTDGLNAFLAQPSQNLLTVLTNSVNVWSVNQTVNSMTSPSSAIVDGQKIIVSSSDEVNWMSESSNIWSVENTITGLGFIPIAMVIDSNGIVYAVGSSGSTGYLSALNYGGLIDTVSWTGSANAVFWLQDQIAVADKTNSLIRVFSLTESALVQENTASAPTGVGGFGYTDTSVWLCGSASLSQMVFTGPYELVPQVSGVASIYHNSAWGTTHLGVGHTPTAGAWDVSGTAWVATVQDDLYNVAVSGGVISGTPMTPIAISPTGLFPPLGLSSMLWWKDGLYGVSSVNQALMLVSGVYSGGSSVGSPGSTGGGGNNQPPPPPTAPNPPTNLTAKVTSSTSFLLSWTASTSTPAPKYSAYLSGTNTFAGSTVSTSLSISGLQPGKTYSVYIVDQNVNGVSAPSSTVSVTLPANNNTAPSKPTNVVVVE